MNKSLVKVVYLPATDTKGSRIKATHAESGKSLTISYDYSLSPMNNKLAALKRLIEENPTIFPQDTVWVFSEFKDVYYFIKVTEANSRLV